MNDSNRTRPATAGGFFIATFSLAGVIAGGFMGQPTIGLLAGLALGVAIAIALWWTGRER